MSASLSITSSFRPVGTEAGRTWAESLSSPIITAREVRVLMESRCPSRRVPPPVNPACEGQSVLAVSGEGDRWPGEVASRGRGPSEEEAWTA